MTWGKRSRGRFPVEFARWRQWAKTTDIGRQRTCLPCSAPVRTRLRPVGWPAAWSLFAILLSVTICLVTGIVFGWYPARQAADLDPIKALHAE